MIQKTIVIASGGTGGHLYPTIAVAEELRDSHPEIRVVFVGTSNRIEAREVPKAGFEFRPIEINAPGKSLVHLLKFPVQYQRAYRRSQKILRELNAGAFLGGGAYLSVPVAFAAKRQRIPIAILEINAIAGRANKVIAGSADKIFLSYPEASVEFAKVPSTRIQIIGTPVRKLLERGSVDQTSARIHFGLDPAKKTLLVFGGSLGARSLNEAMRRSINLFLDSKMNVIWQTGSSERISEIESSYSNAANLVVKEFISEMPSAYAAADLVVARAGASTLAELATLGKPAILVPYPLAVKNHQEINARAYESSGAAMIIRDSELPSRLEASVLELMHNDARRAAMSEKMRSRENITARNVVAEW
ncbi:MAG: undecaprenyldiphospho-muramoylpentapeptide beta-N-acetylglucosaminyltransferase [Bacteroidota bacterium]|nr:undecaprenyldiphospho-muramoylpentapeptide beta-N-acetylglucosaminyltransferase [Bacteroidota bacterium]